MRTNLQLAVDVCGGAAICLLVSAAAMFVPAVLIGTVVSAAAGSLAVGVLAYHAVAALAAVVCGVVAYRQWQDLTDGPGFWSLPAVYRISRWHLAEAVTPLASVGVVAPLVQLLMVYLVHG